MSDKVLLVTGASSDVGIKLIREIYSEYETIYLHYGHMNDSFKQLTDEISGDRNVILLQADFSNEEDVDKMMGLIDDNKVMPNNIIHISAPRIAIKHFHKEEWDNFQKGWDISVRSVVKLLQHYIPKMSKAKYGRIVFFLTSNTIDKPAKYQASYVTYKYALLGLMKALSVEYIEKGITVNGISPDMMETKFLEDIPDMVVEQNAANSPIGRNINIDEVVPVVKYMLSDNGASMTGQNIGITGGL